MIKETETDIIFVETLKKATLLDLLHFDDENDVFFKQFGIKSSKTNIADSLTKIISKSINASILQYIEEIFESKNIKNGDKNGKDKKSSNKKS